MKKRMTFSIFLMLVSMVLLAQTDSTAVDSSDKTYDLVAKIIAAVSLFLNGWQAWLNVKGGKAKDLLGELITSAEGGFNAAELKSIVNRAKDLGVKESK